MSLALRVCLLTSPRGEPLPQKVVETKPNVIIAAECVYFEPAFPLLMTTLQDLLALNPDAIVYFCFKKRRRADMRFVKMARKAFAVDDLHDDDRPVFQRQGLFLFRFRSKTAARAAAKASASSTAAKDKVMVHTDIAATDETVHTASAAMDKMTVNAATDKTVHSAAVSTTGSTTDAASTASSTCSSEGGNTTELP